MAVVFSYSIAGPKKGTKGHDGEASSYRVQMETNSGVHT